MMKFKSLNILALVCLIYATSLPVVAASLSATSDLTVSIQDDNKKDKKKKDKKKKKEKEVKSPEEVMEMIKALEWNKPARSGLEVDKYYDDADEFFKMIKNVDQRISLFKVCKIVSPSGESIIAPVEIATGKVRHKNEAFSQVMESVAFGTELGLQSALLATGAVSYAVQIGQDAIPFVGNSERKTANVQIAKAVKAFPLLKKLIDSQRNMMNRYFKDNANIESTDSVTDAIATGDVDFIEVLDMSDEELEEYMAAEAAAN